MLLTSRLMVSPRVQLVAFLLKRLRLGGITTWRAKFRMACRVYFAKDLFAGGFEPFLNLSLSPSNEFMQQASFLHQFIIVSHFLDLARFHHTDFIIAFDDIQPVNHGNQGGFSLQTGI